VAAASTRRPSRCRRIRPIPSSMVRMLSVLLDSRMRLEAFRDPESAEQWLDGAAAREGA